MTYNYKEYKYICAICDKYFIEFNYKKTRRKYCSEICANKASNVRSNNRKKKLKNIDNIYKDSKNSVKHNCVVCTNEFYGSSIRKYCSKKCMQQGRKQIRKKSYQKHKYKICKKHREYRKNNKKRVLENDKRYRNRNREKINYRARAYKKTNRSKQLRRERRKNKNIYNRLHENISRNINRNIKTQNGIKCGSLLLYLPYTIEELKKHIESQFESWMNWDNYGTYRIATWDDNNSVTWKWQIDHIIPSSKLPYNSMEHPNFLKCWRLDNLRPFSAKENLLKGNK